MPLAVAVRSAPSRTGFCPRCDAPVYSDEELCHYCVGVHGPNLPPLEIMALLLGGLVALGFAAAAAAGALH